MSYTVKEVFVTLQGEGMRAGTRAVFVRFTGCNLWAGTEETRAKGKGACASWCDTDFTAAGATKYETAEAIAARAAELWGPTFGERWVVLTGGEPFLQLDHALVDALHDSGFRVAVETNGTIPPACAVDWLCCSPKLNADGTMPELALRGADELKVVLGGTPDWTDEQLTELRSLGYWRNLLVNPMDATAQVAHTIGPKFDGHRLPLVDTSLARCMAWVHAHPEWRLGYQLHKVFGVP